MSSSSSSTPLLRSSSLALLPPLLLFLLLPSLPSAAAPLGFRLPRSEDAYLNRHEHWIDQTLDHFSPTDHRKFSQRYYEFLDYFNAPDGPVFLKICGEYPCHGIINDYMSVLARKFGAAVVSLEHRYYGKSSPFRTFTTENLRYLSSKQALFDLAVFRQYYQDSLNTKFNHTNVGNSWFVFGISYAGALSAWFREKFPHLTCGSLASSGVVLAVYNFTVFDKQVGESAGVECKGVLQEITRIVEERLLTDGAKIKYLFGAASLENVDFLYLLADASAMAFQYGDPDNLCIPLIKAKEAGEDLVEEYARLVKDHYLGTLGISIQIYDRHHLKHVSLSEDENAIRLWWYQVCTEVAYFQVAPSNDSVRSMKIDSQYHLDLCRNVFGEELHPSVDMTNLYYGATKIAGTRIVFTNGSQDPWRHASKQESSPDLPSYIIRCHNCGHGSDMRGCPQSSLNIEGNSKDCTSPEAVDKVREQMVKDIDLWLSQCQETGPDGYPYLLPI